MVTEKTQAFIATGYAPTCNNVEIQVSDCGKGLRYWVDGKVSPWQAIKYTKRGRAYINIKGVRVYMDTLIVIEDDANIL